MLQLDPDDALAELNRTLAVIARYGPTAERNSEPERAIGPASVAANPADVDAPLADEGAAQLDELTPSDGAAPDDILPSADQILEVRLNGPAYRIFGAVWTSRDGLRWERVPAQSLPNDPEESVQLYAVAATRDGLVAAGWRQRGREINAAVWTSGDGRTWTVATDAQNVLTDEEAQVIADITVGGPDLVAVGTDGTAFGADAAIWTSP